jgi:hypothetical protein
MAALRQLPVEAGGVLAPGNVRNSSATNRRGSAATGSSNSAHLEAEAFRSRGDESFSG